MKSLIRKIVIATAALAAAGILGANAAEEQQQATAGARATHATRTPTQVAQLEFFEKQESMLDAPSYDPVEHPDAKPAPHSTHRQPSVFDDPLNTASLGN